MDHQMDHLTLPEGIREANELGCLVSLFQREDDHWQCNLNARVNRTFFVCHVRETAEIALSYCIELMRNKISSEGAPTKMITSFKKAALDIEDLLKDL